MKTLVLSALVAVLSFTVVFSQIDENKKKTVAEKRLEEKEKKAGQKIFASDDTLFSSNKIPNKWKNESVVVLGQKFYYKLESNMNLFKVETMVRRKIILNDASALKDFSEIYYTKSSLEDFVGIQIIKPDGRIVDVDTREAIKMTDKTNIPEFFSNYVWSYQYSYYKLAVPNLEIGDIIDFFFIAKSTDLKRNFVYNLEQKSTFSFEDYYILSSNIFTLNSEYPVMHQKFEFHISNIFQCNFRIMNADDPVNVENIALTVKNDKNWKYIFIYDKDRDKTKKESWCFVYTNYPTVKCEIINYPSSTLKTRQLIVGSPLTIKTSVDQIDLYDYYKNRIAKNGGFKYSYSTLEKYVKADCPKGSSQEKSLNAFHDAFRSFKARGADGPDSYLSKCYTSTFGNFLDKRKIPYEIVVLCPRYRGNIDNLLLNYETFYGIRIKIKNEYTYFFAPYNSHSSYLSGTDVLEGTEAYVFKPLSAKEKTPNIQKVQLPASTHNDNRLTSNIIVSFNDDPDSTSVTIRNSFTGHFKNDYSTLFLHHIDTYYEFLKKYRKNDYDLNYAATTKANAIKREKRNAEFAERKEKQLKKLEERAEEEYELSKYISFNVIRDGRSSNTEALEVEETMMLKGIFAKTGPNYLFNIGKLIGSQYELREDDKIRQSHINFYYARTLVNVIEFEIPAGFEVKGIEELNTSVETESMAFKSAAKIENNKIIVETEKVYKKIYDNKSNWNQYTEPLELAWQFTNKKVLLQKKK